MSFFESDSTTDISNEYIWVEKYRPKTLAEYIGNETLKSNAQQWIDKQQIPHLLFHSRKPGSGKTTLAKILTTSIKCDVLSLNASKERKIDDIRYKVNSFAMSAGFNSLKVCFLDEADKLTADAQLALRNVMETYASHCRFILTCNYANKLDETLISRCQDYHLQPPSVKDVARHLTEILDKENVKYDLQDVKTLMKYYPDIRKIIQTAQQNSMSGTLTISEEQILESDGKLKLLENLSSNKSGKDKLVACRQLLADLNVNDYQEYYDYLFEKLDDLNATSKANIILALADYQFKDAFCANKEINFAACLVEILKNL